jgi:hypothetical protein
LGEDGEKEAGGEEGGRGQVRRRKDFITDMIEL